MSPKKKPTRDKKGRELAECRNKCERCGRLKRTMRPVRPGTSAPARVVLTGFVHLQGRLICDECRPQEEPADLTPRDRLMRQHAEQKERRKAEAARIRSEREERES